MNRAKRQHPRKPRDGSGIRSGFSLIEVLVAMTILAIIVVMCAMVFQQSSLAWQSGTRRAEGNMTLRSLVGFMQREMTQAVDARAFGLENKFSANEAEFVVLAQDVVDSQERAPRLINYKYASGIIRRREELLRSDGTDWTATAHDDADLNEAMPLEDFEFVPKYSSADGSDALPMHVEIRASISQEGDVSSVGVWSAGPNRRNEQGEGDDVRSW